MASILVGVVMGSSSDWDTMQHATQLLQEFGIAHEAQVLSAHRMPDDMFAYAESALSRGLHAIIAGAGGAAHLPGMLAAKPRYRYWAFPWPANICKAWIHCTALCKCPRAYLWPHLPSVPLEQRMLRFSLSPCWPCTTRLCNKPCRISANAKAMPRVK